MRKIKLPKDTEITNELIDKLIENHQSERSRILKMKKYYNNENHKIMAREYTDSNKPSNRLCHGYAAYITDNFVGYMVGKAIDYKSDNTNLLDRLSECFLYNDEVDNNTTLAQEQSICGYAYELMFTDADAQARFKVVDTEEMIVVYENDLEEKELFAIRYIYEDDKKGMVYVYTRDRMITYNMENNKVNKVVDDVVNIFSDVPVISYDNNRQRMGDFEKVLSLIDAYDLTNSDTANDFEYFTNALLVVAGVVMEEEDGQPLDFKNNRVLNFADTNSKAEYLLKNINDSALENYKNRLVQDIHKFSNVINISDENFGNNLSGVAMKYKLLGMENIASIKESKLRKGLMRRIELLTSFLKIKTNTDYTYTEIMPVFTRNIPSNDVEVINTVKGLYGMISEQTFYESIPNLDAELEMERMEKQREEQALEYDNFANEEDDING